jgi:hypothetical protein
MSGVEEFKQAAVLENGSSKITNSLITLDSMDQNEEIFPKKEGDYSGKMLTKAAMTVRGNSNDMKGSIQSLNGSKMIYKYLQDGIKRRFAEMSRVKIQILKHVLFTILIVTTFSLRIAINSSMASIPSNTRVETEQLNIEIPQAYLLGITSMKFLLD